MSALNYLSPISLDGPYVLESQLHVSETGPSGAARLNLEIQMQTGEMIKNDGKFALPAKLSVTVAITDEADEGEEERSCMRAKMLVSGIVSITDQVNAEPEEIKANLRLNAASMFYSFIKAQIEHQTAVSPMQRFTIPAIDPKRLLDSIDNLGSTDNI